MESYDEQAAAAAFAELRGAEDFLVRTAPARTAIEAAMASQRTTPVYETEVVQPAPNTWAGQPNSSYAQAA